MENLLRYRAWDKIRKKMGVVISNNWMTGVANIIIDNKETLRQKQDYILMQSTGLFDKNGTEIFEGDIVGMRKHTLANQHYYEVFKHRGGTFRLRNKFYGCELWLRHERCEVLGNIYENPELMEADNDPER